MYVPCSDPLREYAHVHTQDHVAYAINASFGNFGNGCPSTHPVTLPLLYLETYWDTTPFNSGWANGKQPFVWSMGDP